MEAKKVRELGDAELRVEARKAAEQLFRIRFKMKLGQLEGVKSIQLLRKDIARYKTVERERILGLRGAAAATVSSGLKQHKELSAGEVS